MRVSHLAFLLTLFILVQNNTVGAFILTKRAEISVLTCSPGNEAYSVYGHSAIRVKDALRKYDVVFNYGIFDFDTPNFIYRFACGQTDYMLGAYSFSGFLDEYTMLKRSIYEQVLDLTQQEKQRIFDFLLWNARPENRVYRYNFLFDNCATRVRDVVQEKSGGEVAFPERNNDHQKTFRELLKGYHSKVLWLDFGIDLIVAAPCDSKASAFDEMFLPDYLMGHIAKATIKTGNETRPLVKSSRFIYHAPGLKIKSSKITSPFVVFGILLLLVVYVSARQFRRKRINYLTDYIVFGINGFMGVVMLWFVLFSEHPTMHPNYNLVWAIPSNFIFIITWKIKKWRPFTRYYFILVSAWLLLFMLSGTILPQKIHIVSYIMGAIVLCRSVFNSMLILRRRA